MTRPTQNRLIADDADEDVDDAPVRTARARTLEKPKGGRGPYEGRRQVTAHIDRQLFLWLKSISAQSDKPMVAIFEEALNAYVTSYAAQKKFGQG